MLSNIINLFQLALSPMQAWSHGSAYGGSERGLSEDFQAEKLGFHLESLSPQAFSCPYQRHQREEELFIILKGTMMLRQEGEFKELKAGDLIFFKTGVAHQFYNHSDEPCWFFALSNFDADEICEYPDSRKILNRKDKTLIQDGREIQDYWMDEENPKAFWPQELM